MVTNPSQMIRAPQVRRRTFRHRPGAGQPPANSRLHTSPNKKLQAVVDIRLALPAAN